MQRLLVNVGKSAHVMHRPAMKMGDSPRHYNLYVQRELRRIGVDLERLGGLTTVGGPSPHAFLRWLRTVPGALGHDAFLARLDELISQHAAGAPMHDVAEAADVATFRDPDINTTLEYHVEFDRVVPPASVAGRNFGYSWPRGQTHALSILRALPDGAGLEAYLAALRASASDPV